MFISEDTVVKKVLPFRRNKATLRRHYKKIHKNINRISNLINNCLAMAAEILGDAPKSLKAGFFRENATDSPGKTQGTVFGNDELGIINDELYNVFDSSLIIHHSSFLKNCSLCFP